MRVLVRIFRAPLVFFSPVPAYSWFVKYLLASLKTWDGPWLFAAWALHVCLARLMGAGWWYLLFPYIGGSAGVLLFHAQHGVNEGYRYTGKQWDFSRAALQGSTNLLVTLGIEYHHIHHFSVRVPSYKLRECHESAPSGMWEVSGVTDVGARGFVEALSNVTWDEEERKLKIVPFIYSFNLSS